MSAENRPGLSTIEYRAGTYGSLREAMLDRISGTPELAALGTRRSDDFAIALLELWAAVGDVLTFYQERHANEAFLRTATRRESVARLVRLLDYELRPGVAAAALVAFTVQPETVVPLAAGSRVASVPGPGEQAQLYETAEPLRAPARWNRLRIVPAPVAAPALDAAVAEAELDPERGPALTQVLAVGDRVAVFSPGGTLGVEEKEIAAVRVLDDRAVVRWTHPIQRAWPASARAWRAGRELRLFGHAAPATWVSAGAPAPGTPTTRLAWTVQPVDASLPAGRTLALDGRYDGLAAGGRLLVSAGTRTTLVEIESVTQARQVLGPLADTVTVVTVRETLPAIADRRTAVVRELTDELAFSGRRYPSALTGSTVRLAGTWTGEGVEVGRTIAAGALTPGVVLRPADVEVGRRVMLADATSTVPARIGQPPVLEPASPTPGQRCHLAVPVLCDAPLDLDTESAVLLGNVVPATHGESVPEEVLGSGDASLAFQRFVLKRKPLTRVPSPAPPGAASALEVFVDGVRWTQVASLHGRGADERVYVLRSGEDGTTTVQFGDCVTGARLPTGAGNVRARYRVGVGVAGRVGAGRLTTALDRPTGLLAVTNPLPAEGGADPEPVEAARSNAPGTVRTFGRVVSLRDVEDAVRATGEVAKAQAAWAWDGRGRVLHVTVAGQGGGALGPDARRRLHATLDAIRSPGERLVLANPARVPVIARATIVVEPDRPRARVETAARAALRAAFAFDALGLGRPLRLTEVYVALQRVPGVASVDVDALTFKDVAELLRRGGTAAPVQPRLPILGARADRGRRGAVLPAELAWLEAPSQDASLTATGGTGT